MNATSFLSPVGTQNRPTAKAKGVKHIMTRTWKTPAIREWVSLALLDTQRENTHEILSLSRPLSHAHTHIMHTRLRSHNQFSLGLTSFIQLLRMESRKGQNSKDKNVKSWKFPETKIVLTNLSSVSQRSHLCLFQPN